MPDVGVCHGLACVVIANWVWDKLVVMSEALHISSVGHVMDQAQQYQVVGWTLLHGVYNLTHPHRGTSLKC